MRTRASAKKTAGYIQLRKRYIRQLGVAPRKISTYRMLHSPEFRELCDYYLEGIGIRRFEQFVDYAARLEETF